MNLSSPRTPRVRLNAPPPAAGPAQMPPQMEPGRHCPRCQTVLTDPLGIGLCPRCGYCRSLELKGAAVLAAPPPPLWKTAADGLWQALGSAPAACFPVFVAALIVVPMALVADRQFPAGTRGRALWSAGHLFSGLVLLAAGQAWAITILKRMSERVGWADMVAPVRLWGMTLRRLPATALPVGLGGSGALLMLAAAVWVGGLSYWLRLTPSGAADASSGREEISWRSNARDETDATRIARVLGFGRAGGEERSERESGAAAVSDGGSRTRSSGSTGRPDKTAAPTDSRSTEKCVIVGFVPGGEGKPPGLVLATLRDGQLAFAGIVRNGLTSKGNMLDRLAKLSRPRPAIEGLNVNAVWVRPEMFCEVFQSGADAKGELIDPRFKGLIED